MISRARGEHDSPLMRPWRPQRPSASAAGVRQPRSDPAAHTPGQSLDAARRGSERGRGRHIVALVLAGMALVAGGYAAGSWLPDGGLRTASYPNTPQAWFDAYMAAAVDNASRVWGSLLSPQLAATYARRAAGTCVGYFHTVDDTPVKIERVVELGATAVIELRQRRAPGSWSSVVLDRHGGGWQAVALISGH